MSSNETPVKKITQEKAKLCGDHEKNIESVK